MFSCEFCEISKNTFFTEHIWATASGFYSEKQQFKRLAVFSSIFVNNTKIIADYNFVAPLRSGREIEWILSKYLNILRKSEKFLSRNVVFMKVEITETPRFLIFISIFEIQF